ncbi:MAG: CAP domain-containing protein [Chloroflexota bacterium]
MMILEIFYKRRTALVMWIMLVGALCVANGTAAVTAQAEDDTAAALSMIARLNEWRIEVGVPPLKPNDTLHAMALDQATYLASLTDIPNGNDMHIGRNGEGPRDRALYPQFNWATYGGQPAISEVAAVSSEDWAINFFQNDAIHRDTITSPLVREIGVAAVPHPYGHVYIADLGSRPDVLPALVDPRTNVLYLTQDLWKFGAAGSASMQVSLFDSDGRPLNNGAPQAWAATIPIPDNTGSKLYVLYDDGSSKSITAVDLVQDRVIFPGFIPATG